MRMFRRKDAAAPVVAGIDDFWAWWLASGAVECARAIATKQPHAAVDALSSRVEAVAPGLAWELAPGSASQHQLVVTAEGHPELRPVARRWLRGAPPADATWEYADARRRVADLAGMTLSIGGCQLALDEVVVLAVRVANHLDVAVHHPSFPDLDEQARQAVTFLALDTALGELAVETWIGGIAPAIELPPGAGSLADLRRLVDDLVEEHTADGGPAWVLLRGEGPGGPFLAAAQVPLAAPYAPHLDQHVLVSVGFADRTEEGFPGEGSLAALRAFEDHLSERLGGSGRLVAHETSSGVRELHYYVDSATPAPQVLQAAIGGWDQGEVILNAKPDPSWEAVRHLRT